ncbi:type IV secretion system protein VirB3 [Pelagibius sp. Alg239-R121]|uniref:type IV secretion system protein VirB3 n=1 Tax=Pelagibius sp. Alg239-R121 TaxID=2993448 RepID=UPI0024A69ED9|nr:VirB3 family type IV secretion system protein [Pelagibius sp. Alg239-R121]
MTSSVYTGMTRPAERLGVPISFWLVGSVGPMVLFILTQNTWDFWGLLSVVPMYFAMRRLAQHDSYLFTILNIKLKKTPPTLNSQYWRGNSYAPE